MREALRWPTLLEHVLEVLPRLAEPELRAVAAKVDALLEESTA